MMLRLGEHLTNRAKIKQEAYGMTMSSGCNSFAFKTVSPCLLILSRADFLGMVYGNEGGSDDWELLLRRTQESTILMAWHLALSCEE
jgi:hypothetical protein